MLIPHRDRVFENLERQSGLIVQASKEIQLLNKNWSKLKAVARNLKKLENKGDLIIRTTSDDIESFILPIEREDIQLLANSLDDILDSLEEATNRLFIYKIERGNETFRDFTGLIMKASLEVNLGVSLIKGHRLKSKDLLNCYGRLHLLENQGDKLHRKSLELIMGSKRIDGEEIDILSIIKWKEIFQDFEDVLDLCEEIAKVFEHLRLKYS